MNCVGRREGRGRDAGRSVREDGRERDIGLNVLKGETKERTCQAGRSIDGPRGRGPSQFYILLGRDAGPGVRLGGSGVGSEDRGQL